jgi:cobalamin biosynthesis Co2+ chelatase CbiK
LRSRRPSPRDWKTWDDALKRDIVRSYNEGKLIKEIAEATGMHLVAIGEFLRSIGVCTNTNSTKRDMRSNGIDIELRVAIMQEWSYDESVAYERKATYIEKSLRSLANDYGVAYEVARHAYVSFRDMDLVKLLCHAASLNTFPQEEIRNRMLEDLQGLIRKYIDASATM